MGKLFLKDEVVFFTFWALTASYSAAETEFFYQPVPRNWDEARSHCQACFEDLVTVTPENIQKIIKEVWSEAWVGLRKNFTNSNFTSNFTNSNFTSNFTSHDNNTSDFSGNSTSNSTHGTSMPWSRWANGDPLSFQNWYPGWPVLKPSLPKRYCCSCSCTCPRPTTPESTTQSRTTQGVTDTTWSTNVTSQDATSFSWLGGNTTEGVTAVNSFTDIRTDQQTDFSNVTEDAANKSSFTEPVTRQSVTEFSGPGESTAANVSTQSIPLSTTTTSQPQIQAECVRSPMPDVPDVDENYFEDSCVAMLSFGAWIEKECSMLLPSICYEERFIGRTNVRSVTSSSANLTWQRGPGDISHYRVEVNGQNVTLVNTTLTYNLENLTAGYHYSVKVFAVKCKRDLNPQELSFYTKPNKVLNLRAANQTETSISLIWDKPVGNADFYVTKLEDQEIETENEIAVVEKLTPGNLYTFTVVSAVKDRSQWSEKSTTSAYTRPGKVSDLKASKNTNTSLLLTWKKPVGNSESFSVSVAYEDSNMSRSEEVVNQTQLKVTSLPTGSRITLSVRAMVNHTLKGDMVTIHSYTAPAPISHLTLTSGANNISASWKHPNGTVPSFSATLDDRIDQVMENNITGLNVVFKGLKSGTNYTVKVFAVSGILKSPSVTKSIFTLPMPPTDLEVTAFDNNTITLVWKAPVNSSQSGYAVNIASSFWKTNDTYAVTNTSYKFQYLKPGTNYTMSVKTVADQRASSAAILTHSTEADKREISLSMLCSSRTPLLCAEEDSRESILKRLKEEMEKQLGDMVFWEFEG